MSSDIRPGSVDQDVFRDVVGRFATGVTVLTTDTEDGPTGSTASAVASLSMEPPMMLVCLNRSSATHDHIRASGRYGVNILAKGQEDIAFQFSRRGPDKFHGVPWTPARNGVPLITGSLATIACRVVDTAEGGTHTIFIGEVVGAGATDAEPLTYYRGSFGRFEFDADDTAYQGLRGLVLGRGTAPGQPLDLAAAAAELRVKPAFMTAAAARLVEEGLLAAGDGEAPVVAPLGADAVTACFAAQAALESGVIDMHLPHAGEPQLDAVRAATDALAALDASGAAEQAARVEAIRGVHRAVMQLSPSRRLFGAFEECSTSALWAALLPAAAQETMVDADGLIALGRAAGRRDLDGARAAIHRHLATVSAFASTEIAARGGIV